MHWNDADEIIRDLKDAPREKILEVLRETLLKAVAREGERVIPCRECNMELVCDKCGHQARGTQEAILSSDPWGPPTPFYLALQSAKVST